MCLFSRGVHSAFDSLTETKPKAGYSLMSGIEVSYRFIPSSFPEDPATGALFVVLAVCRFRHLFLFEDREHRDASADEDRDGQKKPHVPLGEDGAR